MRGVRATAAPLIFGLLGFALVSLARHAHPWAEPVALAEDGVAAAAEPVVISAGPGTAAQEPALQSYGPFVMDPRLEPRVRFWIDVYSKYHSWEMVLHDTKYPQLVFSVTDTREFPKTTALFEKKRMMVILRHLANLQPDLQMGTAKPENLKPEERRILEIFEKAKLGAEIPAIAEDAKRLRTQSGLRDTAEDALFVSGRYLPPMQGVFAQFGLPEEIAYLPFVESGFNRNAISKVGASGIWQFMPYTGKLYLRVDDVVDERNDPMRAAEAAARLMKQNIAALGDWPLAITAYNHGTAGMARAAREVGSKQLCDIIGKYESPTFGFASQNFYASFLAALQVTKHSDYYLGIVPRAHKLEFDEFVMPDYMDLKEFLGQMAIDGTFFRELNPALTEDVYTGEKRIPVGYTVRVPVEARNDFLSRYEAIPVTLKYREQRSREPASVLPAEGVAASPAVK